MMTNPWLLAIRPRTLPAAIGPLLVGNMLAVPFAQFNLTMAFLSTLCAVLLQIAVNLANDYFDFKSGVDTEERLGPIRVTQSGLLSPNRVRNAMLLSLVFATLVGMVLILHAGWVVAVLAILAVLGALGYSGGPYPMASNGLGEVAAVVFFGWFAVVGAFYIQTGTANDTAWLLGTAIGLLNAAIMLVNNTRDMATDIKANKRTVAVRIGEARAKQLYQALVFLPYVLLILGAALAQYSWFTAGLTGISIVLAIKLNQGFAQTTGAALNPLLGKTAQLCMLFSFLFSLGLLLQYQFS